MAGNARSWGALLALLVGAVSSLACGVEAGAQDPAAEVEAATAAAHAKLEALQAAGALQEAVRLATARVEAEPDSLEARLEWAKALSAVGRYEDVAAGLAAFLDTHSDTAHAGPRGIRFPLGKALAEIGRYDEARLTFEAEVEARGPDRLAALASLGEIALATGDREDAIARFDALIDAYNDGTARSAAELEAVATACRHLGATDPELFKDALKAFDEAIAADRRAIEPRVALSELFLEKYNGTEARGEVEAALSIDPHHAGATLAMARVLHFEGAYEAMDAVEHIFTINPNFVPGRVFMAQLLLELESYDEAEKQARLALEVNPRSLDAQAILAAARYLRGDEPGFRAIEKQVLAANPHAADFYNVLGDACVRNRLYRQAVEFGQRAVEVEPTSWRGWGLVGLNQLREGEIETGRDNLEKAFGGDPYNVWFKNTLDLVDKFEGFGTHQSRRFELVASKDEADVLAPYALALAEEAYDVLAKRYGVTPPTPIRLEFFPAHADFSVRTIGLAGMGALGVCFGKVIAQDSPRARPQGHFNWGSTLWHELAHTFTLAASDHRVPRWLTEGLSVLEERRARPGWGDDLSPLFLTAWRDGELLPVAELNNGFVRPNSSEQIGLSYYQASLVVELIERDWGKETILGMLHGYRDNLSTEEILKSQLKIELAEFDRRFDAFLEESFGGAKRALGPAEAKPEEGGGEGAIELPEAADLEAAAQKQPDNFPAQLSWGIHLVQEERAKEAEPFLVRARDLYPQYVGPDSPYLMLAKIYRDRGDNEEAAGQLRSYLDVNETDYEARIELATIEQERKRSAEALAPLEEAIYVYPLDPELHRRMADLYQGTDNAAGMVRARAALVALQPTDMAQALYDLAQAHLEAGQPQEARRQVLRALEVAPSFQKAQQLLLRLHESGGDSRTERP